GMLLSDQSGRKCELGLRTGPAQAAAVAGASLFAWIAGRLSRARLFANPLPAASAFPESVTGAQHYRGGHFRVGCPVPAGLAARDVLRPVWPTRRPDTTSATSKTPANHSQEIRREAAVLRLRPVCAGREN